MKAWTRLLFCATALTTAAIAGPALAADLDEKITFSIAPGRLDDALIAYSKQADLQVISASSAVTGKQTAGVAGAKTPREALALLLKDSGLSYVATSPTTVTVSGADASPQSGSAAGGGAEVEALIVTAQKREEAIQDVPIAISAFSQKDLEAQKIEGGFDLLKAIPNVTFSKNNFTGYNFSIRGVGTKAVSATTDPGVAVAFNNTTLLQNRLFEQEYFDVERVEVLRGPQGTLFGRNATSGVINVISRLPTDKFEGQIDAEVGNYSARRLRGFVNVPLGETFGVRLAASATERDGYGFNEATGNDVDGRDLWSARLSAKWEPTPRFRADAVWEHFEEDDNRARTSKQLCHRDNGPDAVGSFDVTALSPTDLTTTGQQFVRAALSQGCGPGSLYDSGAFGTPNGQSIPFILAGSLPLIGRIGYDRPPFLPNGSLDPNARDVTYVPFVDPYGGMMQSSDLRVISSVNEPVYRAKADVVQLNFSFDLTDSLTLMSQSAYNEDEVYSRQDYNRFNSVPIISDSSNAYENFGGVNVASPMRDLSPGGIFCDPQVGCTDTIAGLDISMARGRQISQEFRLQSDFDGPLNFSLGVNYTKFKAIADYYVLYNLLTMTAQAYFNGSADPATCLEGGLLGSSDGPRIPIDGPNAENCVYIDTNPVDSIDGEGHNYFRSKNPYRLESKAVFGELYWRATDTLKVTAGLRYNDDRKVFTPVPSQLLLAGFLAGGVVNRGYPEEPNLNQRWQEFTGRLGVDWKPNLSFTDETMLYAFYSRGYKGGGANPPPIGFNPAEAIPGLPLLEMNGVTYGPTFEPEFVDAFELGAKNTLLHGSMLLNATAFYYDYKDYQISSIRDRLAVNENFDAEVWGLEFEALWSPTRNFRLNANLGLLESRIGNGERSIDLMSRTADNPDYTLVKPWMQLPSNCVLPTTVVQDFLQTQGGMPSYFVLCGGWAFGTLLGGSINPNSPFFSPGLGVSYDPADYPELNDGAGLYTDVGGNALPNSPKWTFNIGAQYTWDVLDGWQATLRGDYYRQADSYHRVYNTEYDKLRGWENANLRLTLERPDDDLQIELYVKNLFDDDPITDAFLNSDDTGLTTNVFVLDPRLIGLSIRKGF